MRKTMLFVSCLILLSGCSKTVLLKTQTPADIAQECDPLPEFDGKTSDDLIDYTLGLIGDYRQCAARHAACPK